MYLCWNTLWGSLPLTLSPSVSCTLVSGCHMDASNSFPNQRTTYFRTSSFSYLLPISVTTVPCHFNPEHRSEFTCLLQAPYEMASSHREQSSPLFAPALLLPCWHWSLFSMLTLVTFCTGFRPLIQVPLLLLKTRLSTLSFWNKQWACFPLSLLPELELVIFSPLAMVKSLDSEAGPTGGIVNGTLHSWLITAAS